MGPLQHLVFSTGAAAVLLISSKKPGVALSCAASGVLVDLDHLIEYQEYCRGKWDWKEFSTGVYFNQKGTVKVIFHSWEAAMLMWGIVLKKDGIRKKNLLYGIATGYTLHLVLDQIGNNLNYKSYFELYRKSAGWRQEKFVRD